MTILDIRRGSYNRAVVGRRPRNSAIMSQRFFASFFATRNMICGLTQ
jgi:hypothetical protein